MTVSRRRHGDELQQAIFEAVFEQITAVGYARLTMDRVAAAAGTSKPVLYRRWEDKDALVLDALRASLPAVPPEPAGEGLREDLITVLDAVRAACAVTAFHQAAAEAGQDCRQLAEERVFAPARQAILAVLEQGARRGEVRPDAVSGLVADVGPALLRTGAIGGDIPDVTTVVDQVLLPLVHDCR